MKHVNITAPWIGFYHKMLALFGRDPDISIGFDEEKNIIKFYVNGKDKREAIEQILPSEVTFGKVNVEIIVVPSNLKATKADTIRKAFEGNPLFSDVIEIQMEGTSNPFTYVMFKPEVVQYWDDNIGDPHGNVTTLAQDLAREILNIDGVLYSTEEEWD